MSNHGIIRRYTLEIEKIDRGNFPTFNELKKYLNTHGFEISDRTIQRDIEQIRIEFGVEIKYNREKNGYYIDYEKSINTDSFFKFLEIVNTANLLTESLSESKEIINHISFDSEGGLKNIEYLKPLLEAIRNKRKISFNHFNFHTNKTRKYIIEPYLLKEYQNRWYIVGYVHKINEFRTFGIERINNLVISAQNFVPKSEINPNKLFEQTIGLVYSYGNVQKVILSFSPTQGKYIKTLPMHNSQQILIDDKYELRISLDIIPNYELIQLILKHGSSIEVIEPKWLRNEIKQHLKSALKKY